MNISALEIKLKGRVAGILFIWGNGTSEPITRFVADDAFARDPAAPTLSLSMRASDPQQQAALWADVVSQQAFNGTRRLPVWFQNLLPEGVFRRHIAQIRNCDKDDNFELLAATGKDLPGAVAARPFPLSARQMARLATQDNDALEMSVSDSPLPDGVSLSGVQPKLGLIEQGGRYVARARDGVTRIIGKLPQYDRLQITELEALSLGLARAAGVETCEASLQPLSKLGVEHGYEIGGSDQFLAVRRFDREAKGGGRIHCEDFAQILEFDPDRKYDGTYAAMAGVMMQHETMGEAAVHELLRRITVNELLGNYDGHLKNYGVIYPDGTHPVFSPAYDIVAWSAYIGGRGNALAFFRGDLRGQNKLSPALLREFCHRVQITESPAAAVIRATVKKAYEQWPDMIEQAELAPQLKTKLLAHFWAQDSIQSLRTRVARRSPPAQA